jgi:hypothetical protein
MIAERPDRRRFLRGGMAAGALFLPLPYALVWAQTEGTIKLLRAPKVALVIGNGAYRNVPALKNPGNDSRAIADSLRSFGFDVTLAEDATRREMAEMIEAYAKTLAAKQSVGLFYYAGHGLQLRWQNYLLPVDAKVASAEDVAAQCVDITSLMGSIRKAANPMNVVVLDACRDNPFGTEVHADRKGLSQADAPTGTLLAYATAPGNVADDGAGGHGLYTENLLREMKVREARIEDVFKRVRLGVRRASAGRQIPWESTSLEDDFYFLPPEQLRKLSGGEEERAFREELAMFEKAKVEGGLAPLEAYLRKYPSGHFAELAQLRLETILAVQGEKPVAIAASRGNPYTAGTVRTDTNYKPGDRYVYRTVDRVGSGAPSLAVHVVTSVSDTEIIFNQGTMILDRLGNVIQMPGGRRYTPRQDKPLEYVVGKRWSTRYGVTRGGQDLGSAESDFKVAARETITVEAGDFDCYRVEAHGVNRRPDGSTVDMYVTYWMAPGRVRRVVAYDEVYRTVVSGHVKTLQSWRAELVTWEQQ